MWSVNTNTERALNVKRLRSRIPMDVLLGGIGWSEMKKDLGSIKKKGAFLFSFFFRPRLLKPYSYSLRTQSISRAMHISESAI